MISVVQTANNRALAKGLRSTFYYSEMKETVHKRVPKPSSLGTVAQSLDDAPSRFKLVGNFVKHEAEKDLLDKA